MSYLREFSVFSRYIGREVKVLKILIMMYIQKDLTLVAQTLNLFNLHSFSNVGLTHYFFYWEY